MTRIEPHGHAPPRVRAGFALTWIKASQMRLRHNRAMNDRVAGKGTLRNIPLRVEMAVDATAE